MKLFHSEKHLSILKKGIIFTKYCVVTNIVGVFFQAVLESRIHSNNLKVILVMNHVNNKG